MNEANNKKLFDKILNESKNSPTCWDDWYEKLNSLADNDENCYEIKEALDDIDRLYEKRGGFKNISTEEIQEFLDVLESAGAYELWEAVESFEDYFGFYEED